MFACPRRRNGSLWSGMTRAARNLWSGWCGGEPLPNATEVEERPLLPVEPAAEPASAAAPCTLWAYLPSLRHIQYALPFAGTVFGYGAGSAAIYYQLEPNFGHIGAIAAAAASTSISLLINIFFNMPPIANYIRDFRKKPSGEKGGALWLSTKIALTGAAGFINVIGQYWANATVQDAMFDFGVPALPANIMSGVFYSMMVALGIVCTVEPIMDLIDWVEHRSEKIAALRNQNVSAGLVLLGLGHLAMSVCYYMLSQLEAQAGKSYADKPYDHDFTLLLGVRDLLLKPGAYEVNIAANFILYLVYGSRNLNKIATLVMDLVDAADTAKSMKTGLTVVSAILSVAMMAYTGLNNHLDALELVPIIIAVAELNAVSAVLLVNCIQALCREGWSKAHDLFDAGTSNMTSFNHYRGPFQEGASDEMTTPALPAL